MSLGFYENTKTLKDIDTEIEKVNQVDYGNYYDAENINTQTKSKIDEVFAKYSKNSADSLKEVEHDSDFLVKDYKRKDDDKKKLAVLRLKLTIFNYLFITIGLFAFCIFNIFVISNLNQRIIASSASVNNVEVSTTNTIQTETDSILYSVNL